MSKYIDLDAELLALNEPADDTIVVRLNGADHPVKRIGMLRQLRLGARFAAKGAEGMTPDELMELADLLPEMIPTAADYLDTITSGAVFQTILRAVLDAQNDAQPSPGSAEGNGSTVPGAASPEPSACSPVSTASTPSE